MFNLLHLDAYARLDYRLRADGQLFMLEANANPDISRVEDVAMAAARAGLPYGALIERILDLAVSRGTMRALGASTRVLARSEHGTPDLTSAHT